MAKVQIKLETLTIFSLSIPCVFNKDDKYLFNTKKSVMYLMNQNTSPLKKKLGILLFPQFETLDVYGPLQVFGMLTDHINVVLIAEHQGLVQSAQKQFTFAEFGWQTAPHLDYLLIPGGQGTRTEVYNMSLLNWIKSRSTLADITLSVCTGSALLAKTGLLDGLKATTNKLAFHWVMQQGAKVNWIKQARWVDAGSFITSSGISAGIDMSLYVVGRLFGHTVRDGLALRMEYVANSDPSVDPFMVP